MMIGGYGKKPANDDGEKPESKDGEASAEKKDGEPSLSVMAAKHVRKALESGDDAALDKALRAHGKACAGE